jgi:hypothetical protein
MNQAMLTNMFNIDFNIFRDSLRINSEQLLKTLNDNLPEMNLKELE